MPRNRPRQERSKQTVDVLLESTAQVLKQVGIRDTTTEKIATRAGVSIGSLYQYFPNKVALFEALMTQHLEQAMSNAMALAQQLVDAPANEFPRVLSEIMLTTERKDPQLSSLLHQIASTNGSVAAIEIQFTRAFEMGMATLLREKQGQPGFRTDMDPDIAGRILTRTLAGLARRTMEMDPSLMESETFAAEVQQLIRGYLLRP